MSNQSIYKSPQGERIIMAHYDRILARWPVAYDPLSVDTRYGPTFVIASGGASAPALVLLHGSCSNALSWIADVTEYSRWFRVYAVDIPGEPGRSSANRPDWAGSAFAEWLEDLLDGLLVQETSLVGMSQGGWTALKFAIAEPQRVGKLVLLAPGGVTAARPSFLLRAIPLSMLGRPGAEAINRITFGDTLVHEDAVVFMNDIMTHFKPRIGPQHIFTDDELRRLTMPVLLIVGGRDALYASEKTAARLETLVPALTVKILPQEGHVLLSTTVDVLRFLTAVGVE